MASSIKWLIYFDIFVAPWFIPLASHSVFKSGRVERVFDICSRLCFLSLIFSGILESCFQLMMAKTVRIQSNFTKLKPWPREFEIVRFAFKQSRRFMFAFFLKHLLYLYTSISWHWKLQIKSMSSSDGKTLRTSPKKIKEIKTDNSCRAVMIQVKDNEPRILMAE